MKLNYLILSIVVLIAACGPRVTGPPVAPKPSREALAAKPVSWSKRDPAAPVVPRSGKHVQLVITRGWEKAEHLAWLIADGTDVHAVYRVTEQGELAEILAELSKSYVEEGNNGGLGRGESVMMGSFKPRPPPPPPDPGGLPVDYVTRVLDLSWRMNYEANLDAMRGEVAVGR